MGRSCPESLTGLWHNRTGVWDGPMFSKPVVLKLEYFHQNRLEGLLAPPPDLGPTQ